MPPRSSAESLAARVVRGEQAAASRALSLVTEEGPGHERLARALFAHHGRAHKLGLCGPPGSGKSSLINRLVAAFRRKGERVGVLAVDPTSPFTGGAFLGDRLRIQEHALDDGVFMRSLASRGMLGGLSATIFGAVHVLEAYGCDRILIETVGTGQDEVEIYHVADTVLCVSAPNLGDEFQAMKAGFMEIADVFVVNKADLPDSEKAVAYLRDALSLGPAEDEGSGVRWRPCVTAASALDGRGLDALLDAIQGHRDHLAGTSDGRRRLKEQLKAELSLLVTRRLARHALGRITEDHLEALLAKRTDPGTLGARLIAGMGKS